MGIRFNADEVFEIAERIEANAAAFYRRAAELHSGDGESAQLGRLAEMEDRHKATFAAMRAELPERMKEETAFDPYMEAALYLHEAADTHGGEGAPVLSGKESMEDILRIAVRLEEKSIVYYLGIRDMVPAKLGAEKVDRIIAEEKSHIVTLAEELRKLGGK